MGRHSCCIKQKLRKGLWSPEEDEKLYNYITRFGVGCWSTVPKLAGLQRCGKSCRLRWINYLRPDLKRGMFSQQEEDLIIRLHEVLGNRWAQIAAQLPGRTDNEIKNFWNSCLKKKLLKQGIDPNTHQPIIENEIKDHHYLPQQSNNKNNNNNGIACNYDSSSTSSSSSGIINTATTTTTTTINNFGGKTMETISSRGGGYSNNNNNNTNVINRQQQQQQNIYDPFLLLDLEDNNYLNQYYYSSAAAACHQQGTQLIRPQPPPNEFGTFQNNYMINCNNICGFVTNSVQNITNLDQGSMNNNNNNTAVTWDSVNYLQYNNNNNNNNNQIMNGMMMMIKMEEDIVKGGSPSPSPSQSRLSPPCQWQESDQNNNVRNENSSSGDLMMMSNYPLLTTSLSEEDFCGPNLDHVFNHI